MAQQTTVERVRQLLYSNGLYEKPVIIQLAATGNTGIGSGVQTLTLDSTAIIKRGAVLSTFDGDVNNAFAAYVLDVPTTTTITVMFGYHGSPSPSAANLQGFLFEHNPKVTEWEIHEAVGGILNGYLFPDLFAFDTGIIATPDLSTMQAEVPTEVERIISASQVTSGVVQPVKYGLAKNLHTTLTATTNLAWFDFIDGTPLYYSYIRKLAEADKDLVSGKYAWLAELLAVGAAASLMDSAMPPLTAPYRPNIIDLTPQQAAADSMWRNFIQLREAARLNLSRDMESIKVIH